jgi:predicted kinase
MDLLAHRRRDLAFGFLDAYLEAGGDFDGLDVLRLFLVYRALVRALVGALRERARAVATGLHADDYLQLALRLAEPGTPRLLLTHGLPGAGKTHLTQRLLERAGAIRVRSDVERKRLAGIATRASSRAAGDLYTPERTAATYDRLAELARGILQAGYPAIVDAAFLRQQERERLRAVADELGVPFAILDCQAPMAVLRGRVAARSAAGSDPSEADVAVLERLAVLQEPLTDDERTLAVEVRTDQPVSLASLLARWQSAPSPAPRSPSAPAHASTSPNRCTPGPAP